MTPESKVGDKLMIIKKRWGGQPYSIKTISVEKITKTQFTAGGVRFGKKLSYGSYSEAGGVSEAEPFDLEEFNNIYQQIKNADRRQVILNHTDKKLRSATLPQLEAIHNILKAEGVK